MNDFLSPEYEMFLSPIPSLMHIPVGKSTQQLAHAMHIKASSTNRNVEIVENLEHQLGMSAEWYDKYICLCHGNLGTQEHHDATTFFQSIEHAKTDCSG